MYMSFPEVLAPGLPDKVVEPPVVAVEEPWLTLNVNVVSDIDMELLNICILTVNDFLPAAAFFIQLQTPAAPARRDWPWRAATDSIRSLGRSMIFAVPPLS